MATYISLIKLTPQGIATIKDGPARLDSGKEALKAFGSELKRSTSRWAAMTSSRSARRPTMRPRRSGLDHRFGRQRSTETLRAFTEDEYRAIVAALP
jgi:uncharacterized protein with GYD domain